jgi:hypothetical protein
VKPTKTLCVVDFLTSKGIVNLPASVFFEQLKRIRNAFSRQPNVPVVLFLLTFDASFAHFLKGVSTISTISRELTGFDRTVRSPSKRTRYSENRLSL